MKEKMTLKLRNLLGPAVAVIVISVIGLSTTYVTGADVTLLEKGVKAKVDSAAFAEDYYEEQIVPYTPLIKHRKHNLDTIHCISLWLYLFETTSLS